MRTYLDNAATTPLDPAVRAEMEPYLGDSFGNPSSLHSVGVEAARALEEARRRVSAAVGGRRWRVAFTSGGTEANALAILGTALRGKRRHVVVSAVEHPSVLETARSLDDFGGSHTVVGVDSTGRVDPDAVADAIRDDTVLVAVMQVNNEVGTIQPIEEIGAAVRRCGGGRVSLFVDAVQGLGKVPTDALAAADIVSISAHKIHGPKGAGALLADERVTLRPIWTGGGQEEGRRSGTQNVAGIVGLGSAAERAARALADLAPRITALRAELFDSIRAGLPGVEWIGSREHRTPFNLCVKVPGIAAEPFLHSLEARGVVASSGSACHARESSQSHVLRAMGVRDDGAVVRLTLAKDTSREDVARASALFVEAARDLAARTGRRDAK